MLVAVAVVIALVAGSGLPCSGCGCNAARASSAARRTPPWCWTRPGVTQRRHGASR